VGSKDQNIKFRESKRLTSRVLIKFVGRIKCKQRGLNPGNFSTRKFNDILKWEFNLLTYLPRD